MLRVTLQPSGLQFEVAEGESILAAAHLTAGDFGRNNLTEGTRRPLAVPLGEVGVDEVDGGAIAITFGLPAGAYATVVASEVMKTGAVKNHESAPGDEP